MVLRCFGWRLAASAACLAAGAAAPAQGQVAFAPELPAAQMPGGGELRWGGAAPRFDANGQPIYRPSAPRADGVADPAPRGSEAASAPPPPMQPPPEAADPAPAGLAPPEPSVDDIYRDLMGGESYEAAPLSGPDGEPDGSQAPGEPAASLPGPLGPPQTVEDAPLHEAALPPPAAADPWAGLQEVSPGVAPVPQFVTRAEPPARGGARPSGRDAPDGPARTVTGYSAMPRGEAQCRRILQKLGVTFADVEPIHKSRSCGVPYPVRVTAVAGNVAVRPAATLNCMAAARLSQWVSQEVKPAARWKLWTQPTALVNASSYRCSRIAGSRTVSEHATGNAIDIAGFRMANGETVRVEPKGVFDFSEKSFQNMVRVSACEYFGTVLGPGYNRAHDDHFHLDLKERRRTVCK